MLAAPAPALVSNPFASSSSFVAAEVELGSAAGAPPDLASAGAAPTPAHAVPPAADEGRSWLRQAAVPGPGMIGSLAVIAALAVAGLAWSYVGGSLVASLRRRRRAPFSTPLR